MVAWEAIQKTLDWIEGNLEEEADLRKLSDLAGLSEFYFQKLFSRLVGKTVFEYVKLRRLEKATILLSGGNVKVIDIGFEVGFKNHETFTRAFKEAYMTTPIEYKKNKRPLNHFHKPDLSMMYTLIDENVPLIAAGIILEVSRKKLDYPKYFKGLTGQCPNYSGIDVAGELWDRFEKTKHNIKGLKRQGNSFAETFDGETERSFSYFIGAETESGDAQDGYDVRTMPSGEYIVCRFEAENFKMLVTNALFKAIDYMLEVWLPNKNMRGYNKNFYELYYHNCEDKYYMELWFQVKDDTPLINGQYKTIEKIKPDNQNVQFYAIPNVRIIGKSVIGQLKNYDNDTNMDKLRKDYYISDWKYVLSKLPHTIPEATIAWSGNHNRKSDKFTYLLGVITPAGTSVPTGFEYIDLPSVIIAQGVMKKSVLQTTRCFGEFGFKTAFGRYPWNMELYFCAENIVNHMFHWLIPCDRK